jgi:ribosomal protein S21
VKGYLLVARPAHVVVKLGPDGNSTHALIRKFIRKCKEAGIVQECRKRRYYVKKSKKRRDKLHKGIRRAQTQAKKQDGSA